MAVVPESAQLHYLHKSCGQLDSPFPIISCHNVFIFPGVPQYLRRGFIHLEYLFWNPDRQFYSEDVLIRRGEVSLIPILNRAVDSFKNEVAFGSYPQVCSDSTSCTKLTMESFNQKKLDEAREFFRASLPAGSVLEIHDDELVEYAVDKTTRLMSAPLESLQPCEKAIRTPVEQAMQVGY
jgi:FAD synthetase